MGESQSEINGRGNTSTLHEQHKQVCVDVRYLHELDRRGGKECRERRAKGKAGNDGGVYKVQEAMDNAESLRSHPM
jgi:hypothetical protein